MRHHVPRSVAIMLRLNESRQDLGLPTVERPSTWTLGTERPRGRLLPPSPDDRGRMECGHGQRRDGGTGEHGRILALASYPTMISTFDEAASARLSDPAAASQTAPPTGRTYRLRHPADAAGRHAGKGIVPPPGDLTLQPGAGLSQQPHPQRRQLRQNATPHGHQCDGGHHRSCNYFFAEMGYRMSSGFFGSVCRPLAWAGCCRGSQRLV